MSGLIVNCFTLIWCARDGIRRRRRRFRGGRLRRLQPGRARPRGARPRRPPCPPLPPGTEERLAAFTELAATAIANAEVQAALAASRVRVVAAGDAARRRIE